MTLRGGRIVSVHEDASGELHARGPDVVGLEPHELLAPGFVDAHAHLKMEGIGRDVFAHQEGDSTGVRIRRYDAALGKLTPDEVRHAVESAARDHVQAGTTTCWTRVYFEGMGERLASRASPRLVLGRNVREGTGVASRLAGAMATARAPYRPDEPWLPAFVLHEAGLDPTLLREVAAAAAAHPDGPLPIQAHVSQRREEAAEMGQTAVERLEACGVLATGSFVAVHATYCTPEDLDTLVRRQVPVTYCPEAARRAGVGNPSRILRRRTPLLLATDTPPFHMGDQIRRAVADAGFSPLEAFEAATSAPAAALRLPLGSIQPFLLADLALWRLPCDARDLTPGEAVMALAARPRADASIVGGRCVHDETGRLQAEATPT